MEGPQGGQETAGSCSAGSEVSRNFNMDFLNGRGGGVLSEALNPFASVTKKNGQAKIGSVQTNSVRTKLFAEITQIGQT